jgi:hypothetical protein
MIRLTVRSRIDADGVLRVAVPIGLHDAEREVNVTIEPIDGRTEEQTEYVSWLDGIAGKWQGDFERLPELDFEERDPL